ncbi:YgdI/YgdR family lipoprotein [Dongshaea marina]|uniref:YgdI/YgdR family lipoprotein n=1 Tax=Dongshaea marina TaxID=2047966 RepID=UPI000D3E99D8|nr:YgdI/YgdR family lipoprotein [Dongshaea marina]
MLVKNITAGACAMLLALTLIGCSSQYVMTTKNGQTLVSQGKPEIDSDTGMITYEDAQGNYRQINRDELSQVIEK